MNNIALYLEFARTSSGVFLLSFPWSLRSFQGYTSACNCLVLKTLRIRRLFTAHKWGLSPH